MARSRRTTGKMRQCLTASFGPASTSSNLSQSAMSILERIWSVNLSGASASLTARGRLLSGQAHHQPPIVLAGSNAKLGDTSRVESPMTTTASGTIFLPTTNPETHNYAVWSAIKYPSLSDIDTRNANIILSDHPNPSHCQGHTNAPGPSSRGTMATLQPPLPALLPISPPNIAPLQSAWRTSHNSAHCHPVFFTEKLRRLPPSFSTASAQQASPVAHGYVYQDAQRSNGGKGAML